MASHTAQQAAVEAAHEWTLARTKLARKAATKRRERLEQTARGYGVGRACVATVRRAVGGVFRACVRAVCSADEYVIVPSKNRAYMALPAS